MALIMPESESTFDRGNDAEDDCPLCLEPLPPFWDTERRGTFVCCGKSLCKKCVNEGDEFLAKARAEGSYGRQERQLNNICPLCRTEKPNDANCAVKMMKDKMEEGRLPLHLYRELGVFLLKGKGGVDVEMERGKEIIMLGAQMGDPDCQWYLGTSYAKGESGLPQSTAEAKRWYLAAAEQGHGKAEYILGVMAKDEGNESESLRYMRSSASKGLNEACHFLGMAHLKGSYGPQISEEEAIRVLSPAAERGHAKSMKLFGYAMCCNNGRMENSPNFTKGLHWMRRAAEKGEKEAIDLLASLEKFASGKCFMCNNKKATPNKAFLRCSRCRSAWYCSKDCQVQHWKAKEGGHKQFCIKWE